MLNSSKNSSKDNSFNYNKNGYKNSKFDCNHNKTVLKITNLVIYFITVNIFKIIFAIQMTFGILLYRTKGFLTVIEIIEFSELTKNKL
ncbi:hypothetical protein BK732_13675 [Bacillus thuringiensis serovar navarrensis]|uniref:Uncharacterized protein n=1 Tax=Bacillus thuringiensis serovar navarrensis TaxID=339658 RepID=A0A243ACL5_BACTU|nr:hypothetical protein BK732_13675 [Bacillus thuringiensis serovar navarrensis]